MAAHQLRSSFGPPPHPRRGALPFQGAAELHAPDLRHANRARSAFFTDPSPRSGGAEHSEAKSDRREQQPRSGKAERSEAMRQGGQPLRPIGAGGGSAAAVAEGAKARPLWGARRSRRSKCPAVGGRAARRGAIGDRRELGGRKADYLI